MMTNGLEAGENGEIVGGCRVASSGSWQRAVRRAVCWIGLAATTALAFNACGGNASMPPILGGESHFLRHCSEECGDGLDCISGVCTRGCIVGDASCAGQFESAICTSDSVEPGAVAVCDVPCVVTNDCGGLGSSHVCESGYCRAPESSERTEGSGPMQPGEDICSGQENQPGESALSVVVRNGGSETLYLWTRTECGPPDYRYVDVRRGSESVDIDIASCNAWCEEYVGAEAYFGCAGICLASPLVRLEPGAAFALPAISARIVRSEIPASCVGGEPAELETVIDCSRQVPLLASTYTLSAVALSNPNIEGCYGSDCTPDASGTCQTTISCAVDIIDLTSIISTETTVDFPAATSVLLTLGD